MVPKIDLDLLALGEVLLDMREAMTVAMDELVLNNPGINVYKLRNSTGGFIMADLYASYANAYVAWLNFRTLVDPTVKGDYALQDYLDATRREHEGKTQPNA